MVVSGFIFIQSRQHHGLPPPAHRNVSIQLLCPLQRRKPACQLCALQLGQGVLHRVKRRGDGGGQ